MVYDCKLDLDSWMRSWTSAKMSWCCQEWDEKGWPANPPGYCCQNLGLGCAGTTSVESTTSLVATTSMLLTQAPTAIITATAYDCKSGLSDWRKEWTASKMSWCCHSWHRTGRWPHETPDYCCLMEHLGCWKFTTSTVTTTEVVVTTTVTKTTTEDILEKYTYDCEAGLAKWTTGWSDDKQTWCCASWASEKTWEIIHPNNEYQEFCCLIKGRGCPHGLIITTSTRTTTSRTWTSTATWTRTSSTRTDTSTAPYTYNCHSGLFDPISGWTVEKKEYCCLHSGLACPKIAYPTSTLTATSTMQIITVTEMVTTKIITVTEMVTSTGSTTDAGSTSTAMMTPPVGSTATFETLPTDVFDCHAGLEHWELWWSDDKQAWCCMNKGVGCSGARQAMEPSMEVKQYDMSEHETLSRWRLGSHSPFAVGAMTLALVGGVVFASVAFQRSYRRDRSLVMSSDFPDPAFLLE